MNHCLFCAAPIEKARRGGERRFCHARHRAAYRDAQMRAAIQEAQAAVAEAIDEMARLSARLTGAMELLERYRAKKTRGSRADGNEKKDLTGPRA